MIDKQGVFLQLVAQCERPGGQREAAKRLGISEQYLCDVLHGRRALAGRLLAALGYKRVVMYEQIGTADPR